MKNKMFQKIALGVSLFLCGTWVLPKAYAAADKTYEQLKLLVDILEDIQEDYVEEVDTQKLIYGAAAGMVKTLDPFSQFMEPDMHKDIKSETEGQFGGLGIRIAYKDGWISVITPLPGTPAYRMGILPDDRIIKIEDDSTKDMSLSDALQKLRGTPGTKVKITIAREPEDAKKDWTTQDYTITREIIKIQSVYHKMLDGQIGYIRITEFSAGTQDDALKALSEMKQQGATALVLDLRNNPGGLLSSAVDIASDFIGDSKLIVYTQGRRSDSRQDFRANAKAPFGSYPLVCLVNGGSASGSEIVTGALQDHHRAVIIGERTFGKFSVQQVIPLSDGSGLRLTVAHYFTPAGRALYRDEKKGTGGISPDIEVNVPREAEIKLQIQQDEIFVPGKQPKSMLKGEERVKDEILERGVEILKAREVLGNLKVESNRSTH